MTRFGFVRRFIFIGAKGVLEQLRRAELEVLKGWLRPDMRILEIGGGSGFQASVVASWGYELMSIDLPERPFPPPYLFPVANYDGVNIPAPDASFDLIFSSNVLEHVAHLPPLFAEMRRVLKHDGRAVHILPTPTWRFWTCLTHYGDLSRAHLNLPRRQTAKAQEAQSPVAESAAEATTTVASNGRRSLARRLRRAIFSEAHGEYPGALSELYYFSRRRWLKVFRENGFDVQQVVGNELFYTGYALFPNISIERRRELSRVLGSACLVYVMNKLDS
ncbi:MAG TPA: class I SAM-dependent methyltransferase [Pyrinomonadaceae bacterium]|nr:class I SAM-dependent methyltransferase [Pyrinomonadaceae bacterium]